MLQLLQFRGFGFDGVAADQRSFDVFMAPIRKV